MACVLRRGAQPRLVDKGKIAGDFAIPIGEAIWIPALKWRLSESDHLKR